MIVKVYENLHFPGEAFQMANALFALIPEARLRDVMGALHRFSDLPLRLLDAEGNILCALGELAGCCALLQRELNTWQECNALHAKAGARARELGGSYIYTCTAGLSHISFPLGNREALLGALVVGPFPDGEAGQHAHQRLCGGARPAHEPGPGSSTTSSSPCR